jgi:CHAD domain-containing protein
MKIKKIKKYLAKKMAYIEKYMERSATAGEEEAVHRLRVGYKKLRAFLRLAALEPTAGKKLQVPPKLKLVYKYAGRLRDIQIHYRSLLPLYDKKGHYPDKLQQQMTAAGDNLRKAIKQVVVDKAIKQLQQQAPRKVSEKTLKKFTRKKSRAIDKQIVPGISDTALHNIRKSLKDITYVLKPMHTTIGYYLPIAGQENDTALGKLSRTLSKHQDHVVGLSLLDTALTMKLSRQDKTKLEQLRKKWAAQKDRIYRNTRIMLDTPQGVLR